MPTDNTSLVTKMSFLFCQVCRQVQMFIVPRKTKKFWCFYTWDRLKKRMFSLFVHVDIFTTKRPKRPQNQMTPSLVQSYFCTFICLTKLRVLQSFPRLSGIKQESRTFNTGASRGSRRDRNLECYFQHRPTKLCGGPALPQDLLPNLSRCLPPTQKRQTGLALPSGHEGRAHVKTHNGHMTSSLRHRCVTNDLRNAVTQSSCCHHDLCSTLLASQKCLVSKMHSAFSTWTLIPVEKALCIFDNRGILTLRQRLHPQYDS